jgi:ribosomal protein S30
LLSGGGYVRDLTPEVQASQRRREQFEQRDALRKLREIAMAS